MELDRVDQEILTLLQRDGRATHAAIAKEVGLTGPAVYARIRRMEKASVIRGYRVIVDPASIGLPLLAYIRVTTMPRLDELDSFESFVRADDRIVECHDIDGEDSFILKVQCASPADLRDLIIQIRAIPAVSRTVSSISLMTVKDRQNGVAS